ncbi:MAG: type II toxin-antitoxin system VapC family toxin [Actinobacteria bacterium]|nr:type II toxin-antitoxin system VapC family toxin [Actinomycetota bacterium]
MDEGFINKDNNEDELEFLIREAPKTYVLDASVCMKWFSSENEEYVEKASSIRIQHRDGKIFLVAPDLLICEVANALSYNSLFDSEKVSKAVESLCKMDIKFVKPTLALLREAINLRFLKKITIYDAIYIALAEYINVQCITADKKLFDSVSDLGSVIFLDDYRII